MLLGLACESSPTRIPHGSPIYMLNAHASAVSNDTQSTCGIWASLPQFNTVPPWSGSAPVQAERWVSITGGVLAYRETTLTVSFAVTQDADQLVFALGAPLNDTLIGTRILEPRGASSGTWTCPATLPFAANSVLVSHNYHAVPAPTGSWDLHWQIPVD